MLGSQKVESAWHQEESAQETKSNLPNEHRDYLVQRHGTSELDPLPSADPADPLNWPSWKKFANLLLVAFGPLSAGIVAAGVIPATEAMAETLGVSLQKASYIVSVPVLFYGWGPFFWTPIARRYGRRPVWLISMFVSCLFHIGSAKSTSYASLMTCRAFAGFFLSPAFGLGSASVTETYFAKERGRYMGVWAALTTLGPPSGGFFMGFVAQRVNYIWIFWIFAIMNGLQFILHIFFTPETLWLRDVAQHPTIKEQYTKFSRIDSSPFTIKDLLSPFWLALRHVSVAFPALSYGLVFSFCSVFALVELPQIFVPKFGFNSEQLGLNFLGVLVGTLIGEQAAGPLSDYWVGRRERTSGHRPAAEYRLWVAYIGFITVIVGLVVFCVQAENLPAMAYNVSPIVGQGISAFGNQVVTTVLITYAVDRHPNEAANIGAFINMSRMTLGFIGPFWWPPMLTSLGLPGSAGLISGLLVVFSILPIVLLQLRSRRAPGP